MSKMTRITRKNRRVHRLGSKKKLQQQKKDEINEKIDQKQLDKQDDSQPSDLSQDKIDSSTTTDKDDEHTNQESTVSQLTESQSKEEEKEPLEKPLPKLKPYQPKINRNDHESNACFSCSSLPSVTTRSTDRTASKTYSKSSLKSSLYHFDHGMELEIHEKYLTLTGDSYTIRRSDNAQVVFRLKSYAYSKSSKKILYTPEHHIPIYMMSPNILSLKPNKRNVLDAPSGNQAFTLRKTCYIPYHGAAVIKVWPGHRAQGLPYLRVEGDFFDRDYRIWKITNGHEQIVATVKRKNTLAPNSLLDRETFVLKIEPDNNVALMVMIVVSIAEHWEPR